VPTSRKPLFGLEICNHNPQTYNSMLIDTEFCILKKQSWALVAHTCTSCYSEGRDWEDNSLWTAWAKSLQDPISTEKTGRFGTHLISAASGSKLRYYLKNNQPKTGGVAQVVECQPSKREPFSSNSSTVPSPQHPPHTPSQRRKTRQEYTTNHKPSFQ
jgi:hypothetical protein